MGPFNVVWFKRDLRVTDHRPLAMAVAVAAEGGEPVLPLFIAEPAQWAQPTMSGRQWAFVAESLTELRNDLAALGQPLIIRTGGAVEILERLRATHGVAGLWSHEETGDDWTFQRDKAVAAWARAHGVPWRETQPAGVIRRLSTRNGWAKQWDARAADPITPPPALKPVTGIEPRPIPTAADLALAADPCPERQPGGSTAARERLETFLTIRGRTYRKDMSSPVTGEAACSRISPHLAWGTISSRETAQRLWRRQVEAKAAGARDGWRGSLSSFNGRIHWRCHFMQKLEDEPRLEWRALHPAYEGVRPAEPDAARLKAWETGETGFPFIDACMRYLTATGWMNFRMRSMLMSFAAYHLWLDWRRPGAHLARLFTDYEPGIHWPQVQMQSGTTGVNTARIYNPVKQGLDQDPTGVFTRAWVPELAPVPDAHLQAPWLWDGAGGVLGRVYPEPIVDHLTAAKAAREAIWGVRKGEAYRRKAGDIQAKHGSRKSGIKNRGQRGRKSASEDQFSFDL